MLLGVQPDPPLASGNDQHDPIGQPFLQSNQNGTVGRGVNALQAYPLSTAGFYYINPTMEGGGITRSIER